SGFLLDDFVGIATGPDADELLRGVELTAENGEHVHTCVRFALQQNKDVVPVDFEALGLFDGYGVGLMRSLVKHGSKTEEFAVGWLVDDDFLMVFIHGCDADSAGHHDVGASASVADFVNTLARRELFVLDLLGEKGEFVVVEKGEERNVFQSIGITGHRAPRAGETELTPPEDSTKRDLKTTSQMTK